MNLQEDEYIFCETIESNGHIPPLAYHHLVYDKCNTPTKYKYQKID